jgi:hypothetical protein
VPPASFPPRFSLRIESALPGTGIAPKTCPRNSAAEKKNVPRQLNRLRFEANRRYCGGLVFRGPRLLKMKEGIGRYTRFVDHRVIFMICDVLGKRERIAGQSNARPRIMN